MICCHPEFVDQPCHIKSIIICGWTDDGHVIQLASLLQFFSVAQAHLLKHFSVFKTYNWQLCQRNWEKESLKKQQRQIQSKNLHNTIQFGHINTDFDLTFKQHDALHACMTLTCNTNSLSSGVLQAPLIDPFLLLGNTHSLTILRSEDNGRVRVTATTTQELSVHVCASAPFLTALKKKRALVSFH